MGGQAIVRAGCPSGDEVSDVLRKVDPTTLAALRGKGFDDRIVAVLAANGRSAKALREIADNADDILWDHSTYFTRWQDGETFLRTKGYGDGRRFEVLMGKGRRRIVDSCGDIAKTVHESKVGAQSRSRRLLKQLDKDCHLLKNVKGGDSVWHFAGSKTPSGRYRFGPSGPLLDELVKRRNGALASRSSFTHRRSPST